MSKVHELAEIKARLAALQASPPVRWGRADAVKLISFDIPALIKMVEHGEPSSFSTEEVLQILRNVGVDPDCSACAETAFTGSSAHSHKHAADRFERLQQLLQNLVAYGLIPDSVLDYELLHGPTLREAAVLISRPPSDDLPTDHPIWIFASTSGTNVTTVVTSPERMMRGVLHLS